MISIVTFLRPFSLYNPGERACFPLDHARRLVESGVAEIKEIADPVVEPATPDHDAIVQTSNLRPKRK